MKRSIMLLTVLAFLLYAGRTPALAQRGRGGGPPAGVGAGAGAGMTRIPSGMPEPSSASNSGRSSSTGAQVDMGKRSASDLLAQNTKLSSQIGGLTGMDAQQACSGFKNLGQCVAAAHVSKNLGIDFSTLKGKITGSGAESLGQAIHDLNPNVNAKAETKKGQQQAHADLKESGS